MWTNLRAFVFDVDGVLVNSVTVMYRACCHIFERGHPSAKCTLSPGEFFATITGSFTEFYQTRGVSLSSGDIGKLYWDSARDGHDTSPLYHDVMETIPALSDRGIPLAIVSAHFQDRLEQRFRENGLERHFRQITGDAGGGKRDRLIQFCHQQGLPPGKVAYLGDLPADMHAARDAGLVGVGVTRSHGSGQALRKAGAYRCITNISELLSLLPEAAAA